MLDSSYTSLENTPLLERLSPHVRDCLLSRAKRRTYSRGETICLHGEPAQTLKVVLRGWVKTYRVSISGNEAILATLGEGGSFDEIAALRGGESSASVEAVSDCELLHIDISTLCSCKNSAIEIREAVLSAAADHLDVMLGQVERLKAKTGLQRLAEFLLDQSDNADGAHEFDLPFEKVVLAGQLGMKPESLSRSFSRLKPVGVSCPVRRVKVADMAVLRDFVEEQAYC